ncbi:MAG: AAA family ATPase [Clostridium sp.]|nr:AAA family ATPase [Clostridium sp.]
MITSIELQVISKILTSESPEEIETLCGFDDSYYSVFRPHIQFILNHREKYNDVPDVFTFQASFPEITLVKVREPLVYLKEEMNKNKQHIILLETFNKLKELGSEDVTDAWAYLGRQCEKAAMLDSSDPLDLIKDSQERSRQVIEFSKQRRIPTGFPEIDKVMYGGFSTVEELVIIVARTNTGKSWVGTRMMESAQKNGFPVLYYSPEMQASFLGTRFDTWRGNFKNSQLHQGKYNEQYYEYLKSLKEEETPAYILEDKDAPDGKVTVPYLKQLVKKHSIKLLVIDGLSYMEDYRGRMNDSDSIKYKNLNADLFRLSKSMGCTVVVMMQANRESKNNKDDKGEVFPNIYNIEGSDHPARIATQVFAMRQIFDKHVLDIRLEKSRNASNQKPEFSYSWDVDTGNMQFLPNAENSGSTVTPVINPGLDTEKTVSQTNDIVLDDTEDDVEF